ncbi:MAG TPA: hypothetical protein VK638_38795 [Edaphobacter sp.]|nr:hypothetical protein [Edaphobacter sp.]
MHIGEIKQHALGKAQTGTPQIVWLVKILGVSLDDAGTIDSFRPNQQYERRIYMALTERTAPFVSEALQNIGFEGEKISQLDPGHPQHVSMIGNQVNLWCSHERDQKGDLREKWQFSRGPQKLELPSLNAKEVRELDALFGKGNRQTKPPAPAQNIHGEEIDDSDIPF